MALTRRKKIVFALVAMTCSFVGDAGDAAGRGSDPAPARRDNRPASTATAIAARSSDAKQPGELRVVMLGGSTVFGYGVAWEESIAPQLEARLREKLNRPVTVVNLGFNNEGAYAFVPNLEDFAYLDYDVIVLYEGYNDLPGDEGVNRSVYRRDSAIYRDHRLLPNPAAISR